MAHWVKYKIDDCNLGGPLVEVGVIAWDDTIAGVLGPVTDLRAHATRDSFLTAQSWDRLHRPPQGATYAMGWVVTPQGWLGHDGSNMLWYATMAFVPGQDRAVFLAANFAGHGPVAAAMAKGARVALQD